MKNDARNKMNLIEKSILKKMYESRYINQRVLAEDTDYALGTINQSLKNLTIEGYIDSDFKVTEKGKILLQQNLPRRAVISPQIEIKLLTDSFR